MRTFLFALLVGCSNTSSPSTFPSNPPPNPTGEPPNAAVGPEAAGAPMGPSGPETPAGAPDPGPTVVGNKPASPPSPPIVTDELPIDPTKPMPADTLGTDATLAIDQPASVMVDARGDIFSAGLAKSDASRGGVLPTRLALVVGGGVIRLRSVHGKTGCGDGDATPLGPDGGPCGGNAHAQSLVGVFLDGKAHVDHAGTGTKRDAERAQLATPRLGETFFVGDGLTGTGTGDIQTFKIPKGATKLYLGYAAAGYAKNAGGVSAIVTQHSK